MDPKPNDSTKAEETAATKIQAQFRGFQTRKSVQKQQECAIKIQSSFRGHQTRNSLQKQQESAIKIQSQFRGHQTRNALQKQQECAVKIQSQFRGHLARKQLNTEKELSSNSLLNTLSTTNPEYYYTKEERQKFKQHERNQDNEKIKLKQQQIKQLQDQERSAIVIQETLCNHQTSKSLCNKSTKPVQRRRSITGSSIKMYRPICKLRAKEIRSQRDNDGYTSQRIIPTHHLIKQYKDNKNGEQPRWYTSDEISKHNYRNDCWVVIFRKIFNLTQLIEENAGNNDTALLIRPLLKFAGQDISDWFDSYTNNVTTYIDPISNLKCAYLPYGRFIDVPPQNTPVTNWTFDVYHDDMPWWQNWKFVVGLKSEKARNIRIVNTLTSQENIIQVATEETLNEIQKYRYLPINKHSESYTWKYQSFTLDMNKTLTDNGIDDQDDLFDQLKIFDEYIQSIYIYFNDDLTVA